MKDIKITPTGLEFTITDIKKWDSLPPPTPPVKEDKYVGALDALEAGEILKIPTKDEKEMKGLRIGFGRKARSRGFIIETRNEGNFLFVRKSDKPIEPSQPKKKKEKVMQEA